MTRRIASVALIAIGVIVAVHTIIEPLYHVSSESSPYSPAWSVIDPLMALAVVSGMIFGCARQRAADSGGGRQPVTREHLAAKTQFYGFVPVGVLSLWNRCNILSPDFTGVGADTISPVWGIIDAALPCASFQQARHKSASCVLAL